MRRFKLVTAVWMVGLSVTLVSAANAGERAKPVGKERAISFRAAAATAQDGFERMSLRGGQDVYVSGEVLFTENEIVSIETVDLGYGQALELSLTPEAAGKLRDGPVDRLAIVRNGRLIAAPRVETITADGAARVTDMSPDQVTRLSRMIRARAAVPVGAILQVVAREAAGQAGGLFTVDVFVRGAANIRTFQVALDATGGQSGSLTREEIWIDVDRADYVFGSAQAIKAVDETHGRMGAVLFDGGVNASGPVYLGTYTFQASSDADGTFTITARANGDTFISDPNHTHMPFRVQVATITVSR